MNFSRISTRYLGEKESEDIDVPDDEESMKENVTADKSQNKKTRGYLEKTNLHQGNLNSNTSKNQNDLTPLTSTRDPRRLPLLDRVPFAPTLHHEVVINRTKKKKKKKKGVKKEQSEITPAYAYRNTTNGLLEIRSVRPPESCIVDTDKCPRGDDAKCPTVTKPALYPIAINGGGVGIYNDPREFGVRGISNFSKNRHESAGVASRGLTVFPWNLENNTCSEEKVPECDSSAGTGLDNSDVEANLENSTYSKEKVPEFDRSSTGTSLDNCDGEASLNSTLRLEGRTNHDNDSLFSPWKTWEKVHNFMVRAAERTQNLGGNTGVDKHMPKSSARTRLSMAYNEDDFDFALVLKPKEVYAFWADLLDFREENRVNSTQLDDNISQIDDDSNSSMEILMKDSIEQYFTPETGIKRRRRNTNYTNKESMLPLAGDGKFKMIPQTEPVRRSMFSPGSLARSTGTKLISIDSSGSRVFNHRSSLFHRAILKVTPPKARERNRNKPEKSPYRSPLLPRVIDENLPVSSMRTRSPISTMVRADSEAEINNRMKDNGGHDYKIISSGEGKKRLGKRNRNRLEIEDIPTQVVPRGIAARTGGMEEFLSALKRGIIVRRHRPHTDTGVFIKITSSDGGDTMQYTPVKRDEALLSLNEQMVRYNRDTSNYSISDFVTEGNKICEENQLQRENSDNFLPDHIAAEKYRDAQSRLRGGVRKKVTDLATKVIQSGVFKAADIVAVHRADVLDPDTGKCRSCALRESKAVYNKRRTFSIVLLGPGIRWTNDRSTLKKASEMWVDGNGSDKSFRFFDIEAATQGEFWMIFRGFLLMQRDAASGRFAAQRASGFSSNYNKRELERAQQLKKEGKEDVKRPAMIFQEPVEKSCVQKWINNIFYKKRNDEQCKQINSVYQAPPSDYFLGFKSSGTQIWGRLRQAGLETQRIYSLDKKRVMIKIRCPSDILMDFAEALRLKLKTADGFYIPFQQNLVNQFVSSNDDDDKRNGVESCLFRSSERQQIIDFIIRSRIRDLGAELGEDKKLGKHIELRVPMHMHLRLERLYDSWVLYYKKDNWVGERNAMRVNFIRESNDHSCESGVQRPIPGAITRFILGSFHQPLDSVEEYFGEGVTFYFAWLEHCSVHLISISAIGLVVFLCQIISGRWDHPLRPYFSVVVMVWSFHVLVHWRKRQNFLAHRWGTLNYKGEETTRPQFHGEWKECKVAGEREHIIHYPLWKRWLKYCISIPLTVIFTVTLLIGMLIVYANRDIFMARYFNDPDGIFVLDRSIAVIGRKEAIGSVSLTKEHLRDPKFWYIILGIPAMLGLALPLFNFILMQISRILNEFENHRTETQYRNALIAKVIAFRFVCYFAALYYYAYIAIGTDQVVVENGLLRVASCLVVYLTVANWWSIFLTIYLPLLLIRWRRYRDRLKIRMEVRKLERMELLYFRKNNKDLQAETERKLVNKRLLLEQAQSEIWEEVMLPDYDPFADYVQAVMNFTYVVCFSAILPITPLFVLINQLLSMRLNAYKICRARRRPLAQKTGGIGVWTHVLHIVSVIAIVTNCSLVALTSSQFHPFVKAYGNMGLFGVIVGWEHIMLIIKYLMQAHYSPYPKSVLDDMKREAHAKTKQRSSCLRAKKEKQPSQHSRTGCSGSQMSLSSYEGSKEGGIGSNINDVNSILSTEQPEESPLRSGLYNDVKINNVGTPIKDIKSEACAEQSQQLRRNKVQERKVLTPKINKKKLRSLERIDNVELKTPKLENQNEPSQYSTESIAADDNFIESPSNVYHCDDYDNSPTVDRTIMNTDVDYNSVDGLLHLDNKQFNDNSYDESLENNQAEQRIKTRLIEIKKRNSQKLRKY